MADDDLVMESTTDSAEQIADGLGVELAPPSDTPVEETPAEPQADVTEGDEGAPAVEEPPVGDVTPLNVRGEAPRHPERAARRPQAKAVSGAAAAARRESDARLRVAETERDAALARIRELTAGKPITEQPTTARQAPVAVSVKPEDVPATHPEIAEIQARRTALGAKPKQEDFPDFAEFEDRRDEWITETGALRAEERTVRKDVATRATADAQEANRAVHQTMSTFESRLAEAATKHADYDAVMQAARAVDLRVSDAAQAAIVESDLGGELTYYLAKNHAECTRISALGPIAAAREIGRLEARLLATQPAVKPATRAVARTTHAPDPQGTTLGDAPSHQSSDDPGEAGISLAEYNRRRDRMDVHSGRRVAQITH